MGEESLSLGQKGENQAVLYLEKAGYEIRHTNWKSGKRELDIVAENSDFIVFVEVKTRSVNFMMPPSKAVNTDKQKSIIYAAEGYINKYSIDKESRFDIITIIAKGKAFEIDHVENAFYPTLR
jgi:putative endonuclease